MWTIFKVFIEFVAGFLFYVLVFGPQGMWDLNSLTRDWTCALCTGRRSLRCWTTWEVPSLHSFIKDTLWNWTKIIENVSESLFSNIIESSGTSSLGNKGVVIFVTVSFFFFQPLITSYYKHWMACGFDFANDFRKVAILGTQIEGPI